MPPVVHVESPLARAGNPLCAHLNCVARPRRELAASAVTLIAKQTALPQRHGQGVSAPQNLCQACENIAHEGIHRNGEQ